MIFSSWLVYSEESLLEYELAAQRERQGLHNRYVDHLANQTHAVVTAVEIDDAVVFRAALQFAAVFSGRTFDQNALDRANHVSADPVGIVLHGCLQMPQAFELDFGRRVIGQAGSRSSRTRTENEAEAGVIADVGDQLHQCIEVIVGFTRKADD